MIEIKKLCVVYSDGTEALCNLSFTIEDGRSVKILGVEWSRENNFVFW